MQSQDDSRILYFGQHERGVGREPTGSVEAMSARNPGFPRWLNRGEAENAASTRLLSDNGGLFHAC